MNSVSVKNGVTSKSNLKNVQFRDFSKMQGKKVEVGATLSIEFVRTSQFSDYLCTGNFKTVI